MSISAYPQSYTAKIGSQVIFNCSIDDSHKQPANIRWYHDAEPLPQSNISTPETGLYQLLILSNVQVNDSGLYTCCVVQDVDVDAGCGETKVDVQLEVGCKFICFCILLGILPDFA